MNYEYCNGITHTIKQGETLYSLSRYYKVPLAILLRANPYIDVYNLKSGDTICIPVKNTGKPGSAGNNRTAARMGQSCGNISVMPRASINSRNSNGSMSMDAGRQEDMGMERNIPENASMPEGNTGIGLQMDINGSIGESTGMDMDTGMPDMNMGMDASMPGMNMGVEAGMPENTDTGMDSGNTDNLEDGISDNNEDSTGIRENESNWIKYVAQAGDTLQDILDRSECSKEMFWEKNSADRMYMLPGVAYFILENNIE